jgi:diguanylate cyclase (GGDEF)-like protein
MLFQIEIGTTIFFMAVCAVGFCAGIIRYHRNKNNVEFLFLCLFLLAWYVCELFRIAAPTGSVYTLSLSLGLVFVELSAATVLFFALSFYRLPLKSRVVIRLIVYAFPVVTLFIALMPGLNSMIYVYSAVPELLSDFVYGIRPWFWVHTAYCFLLVLLSAGVIMLGHRRIPKFYKSSSGLLVFAIFFILGVYLIWFSGYWIIPIAPLAFSFSVAVVLSHFALEKNDQNMFVHYARGYVFQYLKEYILVLSDDDRVTDHNASAAAWFGAHNISLTSKTLQNILDSLSDKGAVITQGPDNDDTMDISISEAAFSVILNLRIYEMNDIKNNNIGSVAIFTDVTENRAILGRLEKKAGIDPLTGIPNRTAYEGARNRLDAPSHFPLSVIVCDVNGLKPVNDRLGHKYGDMMLQKIAEALEANCPKTGFLARIGGDEFIYLLPNTDSEETNALMEQIQETFQKKNKELMFDLSVAMGTSSKISEEEDLESVIAQADSLMYQNKKRIKEKIAV